MKIFFTLLAFLTVESSNLYPYDLDSLAFWWREVDKLYSRESASKPFSGPFIESYNQLVTFLNDIFMERPKDLFEAVRESQNLPMVNFVITAQSRGCMPLKLGQSYFHLSEQFVCHKDSYETFFESLKKLMWLVVKKKDWTKNKEILAVLLSIKRQYFYRLKLPEDLKQKVKLWIEEYEIIYNYFDPDNLNIPLQLFRGIQKLATENDEAIHKEKYKFPLLKWLKLWALYNYHLYHHKWRSLPLDEIPPKFLFLCIFNLRPRYVLKFLKNATCGSLRNFFFNRHFLNVRQTYEIDTGNMVYFLNNPFTRTTQFYKFMRRCVKDDSNPCDLEEKEIWITKAALQIATTFNDSEWL
jgi:hypothetical protein